MIFDTIANTPLTAPALLGVAILLLLLGRIVPRSTLISQEKESERWRQAYEAEREARATADSQTTQLLETAKTTHALLQAVFHNSEALRYPGGSNVSSP